MTGDEAHAIALTLAALHLEQRTDESQALLDTIAPDERGLVFMALVSLTGTMAVNLNRHHPTRTADWLRELAHSIDAQEPT